MENSFERQLENFTHQLVGAITALSPMIMVLIILGIAGTGALIEYKFQEGIWGELAIIPAVLVGGFRFASGMGGINMIKKKRYIVGIAFVIVSLLLTTWASWHSSMIANEIAPGKIEQAIMTIKVILWSGLVGEIMLAAIVWKSTDIKDQHTATPGKQKPVKMPAHSNGQTV